VCARVFPVAPQRHVMASKTILIVDDDRDVRFVLGAILNYDGYHVVEAMDGAEAVETARRLVPDLVIMDVHMPKMDGLRAAEALRSDERTRAIPVLALTGELLDEPAQAARAEAVFNARLQKPFVAHDLRERIREIIGDP
jgi:two-component system cell cycle response regulator DivK